MTVQKSRPAPTEQQTKTSKTSIPAGIANVKNPLRKLRLMKGIPSSTLVQTVKKAYPGYDKTLQSKCERTEEYGIALCFEAMDSLIQAFFPEMAVKAPTSDRRAKPCRIHCRMAEADFERLQLLIKAKGFTTTQEYVHQLLIRQIRRWERGRDGTQTN